MAVDITSQLSNGNGGHIAFNDVGSLVNVILKNSITIIGIILLALLIFGGISYIISAGSSDSKKTAQAQAMITDALIGFAVVLLAYFLIQIIQVITGLNILNSSY